jgi:hypothetical protein
MHFYLFCASLLRTPICTKTYPIFKALICCCKIQVLFPFLNLRGSPYRNKCIRSQLGWYIIFSWMDTIPSWVHVSLGRFVLLLRDPSYKIGKVRLWLIVSLPLAAYLIAIVPTTILISENRFVFDDPSLLSFRIIYSNWQ